MARPVSDPTPTTQLGQPETATPPPKPDLRRPWISALVLVAIYVAVQLDPRPPSIKPEGWRLLGTFAATVGGLILRRIPGRARFRIGTTPASIAGGLPIQLAPAAMFMTGQASNPLAAKIATDTFHYPVTWTLWAMAAIVPGLCSMALVPYIIYRIDPPEIRKTPEAAVFAASELRQMGRMDGK